MTTHKVSFYSRLPSLKPFPSKRSATEVSAELTQRIEPSTCTEAESYVLQVLDDSMQPEFRKGCIIVIDPTGLARDRSYVLARSTALNDAELEETDGYVFRQLQQSPNGEWLLVALNPDFPIEETPTDLNRIMGVIVQRAGTRRRYHKHYD